MNHPWYIALGIVGVVAIVVVVQMVLIPFIKVELRRRESRSHIPQPQEVWIEDNTILYVVAVGPPGVELMTVDPSTRVVSQWRDSWDDWQKRLRNRAVYFTGQTRPLGNV